MSIRLGTNIISGRSTYQPSLFDFKWADHILNDPQWVRADNFRWHLRSTFTPAYEHLVADIQDKEVQSETIAGILITFYLANDGHKICLADQENKLIQLYNSTGIAWYYLLDTTNQTFKLPRTKYGFSGLRDEVGKYIPESLPNHTHNLAIYNAAGATGGGGYVPATSTTVGSVIVNTGTNGQGTNGEFTDRSGTGYSTNRQQMTDASSSNPIYGNNASVQPNATQMYLYFYVGNFTQTALENTVGVRIEDVEALVDVAMAKMDTVLATLYPVGSIYIGTQATCPISILIPDSTWELVSAGRTLQGADSSHVAGSTIEAGLPNITGVSGAMYTYSASGQWHGAMCTSTGGGGVSLGSGSLTGCGVTNFDASQSNPIYGNSNTVQPAAYVVNIWKRTA